MKDKRIDRLHLSWELQKFLQRPLAFLPELDKLAQARALIAFRSPARGFPRVPLGEIINSTADPEILKGKIVVVGSTARALHDFHETSLGLMTDPDIICNSIQTVTDNHIQIYAPNIISRCIYVLAALLLVLLLQADFVKKPTIVLVSTLVLLPFPLLALTFLPRVYPPAGLFYITFSGVSVAVYLLSRIITLAEIRQSLHEAEICGNIQKQFLPQKALSHAGGIVCSGRCVPYQNAGGDYYDFFELSNGDIFFILGDVAGHGISASMITTAVKSIVSLRSQNPGITLEQLFLEINTVLISMKLKKVMLTAAAGIIDFRRGKVTMLSAGHLPPILREIEGCRELCATAGFPLGVVAKLRLPACVEFDIPDRGFLLLYSDGIVEGVDWRDEQLGFERFHELIASIPCESDCNTVISGLYEALNRHVDGRPYEDDVTFCLINFNRVKKQESI